MIFSRCPSNSSLILKLDICLTKLRRNIWGNIYLKRHFQFFATLDAAFPDCGLSTTRWCNFLADSNHHKDLQDDSLALLLVLLHNFGTAWCSGNISRAHRISFHGYATGIVCCVTECHVILLLFTQVADLSNAAVARR